MHASAGARVVVTRETRRGSGLVGWPAYPW
jgi:hypothetical protein